MEDERAYQKARYYENKAWALAYLGGVCVRCGSVDNLEFDHISREHKNYTVTRLLETRSREVILGELELTQLLCSNCHREKTATELSVEHGGGASGKKNCKCRPCKDKKNAYMRTYNRERKTKVSQ